MWFVYDLVFTITVYLYMPCKANYVHCCTTWVPSGQNMFIPGQWNKVGVFFLDEIDSYGYLPKIDIV